MLIAYVHQQHELEVGILVEGIAIQRKDLSLVCPRWNGQFNRPCTPGTLEPTHCCLEMGVVEIGIENRVAGRQAPVLPYQVVN